MFYGTRDDLIYCINKEASNTDMIKSQLISKNCSLEYCGDDWQSKIKKTLNGTKICIENCSKIFSYEYNYICYPECPKGTRPSKYNEYLCENITTINKNQYTINEYKNVLNNFISEIKKGSMNSIVNNIIEGNNNNSDYIKIYGNVIIQITTLENQNNNKSNNNLSSLNIDKQCENNLKEIYNISKMKL